MFNTSISHLTETEGVQAKVKERTIQEYTSKLKVAHRVCYLTYCSENPSRESSIMKGFSSLKRNFRTLSLLRSHNLVEKGGIKSPMLSDASILRQKYEMPQM